MPSPLTPSPSHFLPLSLPIPLVLCHVNVAGAGVSRAPSNWPLILVCLGAWLLCAIYIVMLVYVALVMYTSPKVVREGCPNDL